MPNPKNINLKRYDDGTPSIMRKATVYTELHFYRKSDVLVQLTKVFCERFLPKYGDRTVDQMVQAARSVKQNIAEGLTDGQTSFETEIKLLGIAKGSNQELLEDYLDYLKQHGLNDWAKAGRAGDSRISEILVGSCANAMTSYWRIAAPTMTWLTLSASSSSGLTRRWRTPLSASATWWTRL